MNGASQAQAPENRPAATMLRRNFPPVPANGGQTIDLVPRDATDEMIEFRVMTRPEQGVAGAKGGNRGTESARNWPIEGRFGHPALI